MERFSQYNVDPVWKKPWPEKSSDGDRTLSLSNAK
jgi:hypothetical protein